MTQKDIKNLVYSICSGIKNNQERFDAEDELFDHIMNHYEKNISCGLSEEEAYSKAVEVLGDTKTIGSNLKAIHNIKHARRLLALKILVLLVIVLVLGPWLLILISIPERLSVSKIENVEMYSQITGNYHYSEDEHVNLTALETVKMPIFPEKINNEKRVRNFKDITYR